MAGFRSLALLGLGMAAMGVHGSTAAIDKRDSVAAGATAPVAAAGALGNTPDTVQSAATAPISGSVSLFDLPEQVAASTAVPTAIASSVTDARDITAASVSTVSPRGFRSLASVPLNLGRLAIASIGASASLKDGPNNASSSAGGGVLLTSINSTSDYRITSTADLIVGDRIELLSATGGPITDITINPDATFTLVLGSTVSSFLVRVWSITDQDWGGNGTQFIAVFITSSPTDRGDLVQATGGPVIGASVSLIDRRDGAAASVIVSLGFSAALQDSTESLSAAVVAAIAGSTGLIDQPDGVTSAAALSVSISIAANDLPDLISSIVGASQGVLVSVLQEAGDSSAGAAVLAIGAAGSIQDQADRIAAAAVLPASITSAVVETADGMVSVIAIARFADSALLDTNLDLLANAAVAMVANFTGLDAGDILRAGAVLVVQETTGGYVAELLVPDRLFTFSLPARTFTLSPNTGKKS